MSGIRTALLQWGVGRRGRDADRTVGDGTVVLLQRAGDLPDVVSGDLAGRVSTVFVPGAAGPIDWNRVGSTGPRVIEYQGSANEAGDEVSLSDEFFMQVQAYAVSEFMSVLGPTLVRITDEADLSAYLADADRARSDGEFPGFLINPAAQLADVAALGAGPDRDGPTVRLAVDADGLISTSVGGARLARLGECTMDDLLTAWSDRQRTSPAPCAVALDAVLDDATRSAELAGRPWLGRYLAAVEALRITTARGLTGIRVSGFGGTLAAAVRDVPPVDDGDAPLVLWNEDTAFVHDPRGRRTFGMDLRTAGILDVLITAGGVRAGREFLPEEHLRQGEMLLARAGLAVPTRPAGQGVR